MTKDDIASDDISHALHERLCQRCDGRLMSSTTNYCDGGLVMSAYYQAVWMEKQQKVTAKERGGG
jgi:hypothetical protein